MESIEVIGKVVEIGNLENTDGAVGILLQNDDGKHVAVIGLLPEQIDSRLYGKRVKVAISVDA